jgi:hypothetical protein
MQILVSVFVRFEQTAAFQCGTWKLDDFFLCQEQK